MNDDPTLAGELDAALGGGDGVAAVLAMMIEKLGAETGSIHLLGSDGLLHVKAAQGIPDVVLPKIQTIPVGRGMAGLAVERCEPITVCNLQTDDSGDVRPGAKLTGMQGSIVVPILRGEQPIGAFGVANQAERTFTEAEIALLLQAGRAIAARE